MTETTFTVPRATGTHADVLLVTGPAALLASGGADTAVRIQQKGAAFEVTAPIDDVLGGDLDTGAGYAFLRPRAKVTVPPGVSLVLDYEVEKARIARFHELRQMQQKAATLDPEAQTWLDQNQPRSDWRQWQVLNLLQGYPNTNRVHARLAQLPEQQAREEIGRGLAALQGGEPSGFNWGVSSVQLFNPNAAKGYARLKPDTTDRNDKTKEAWVDSFAEWLRYRGYFVAACPFYLDRKAERIRLVCPIPADISLAGYRDVVESLRGEGRVRGGEPKVDALALLYLARLLIERSEMAAAGTASPGRVRFRLQGRSPARIISGVSITQYQSLGSARAVSQLNTLALPDWFAIDSPEDARTWLDILDEHRRVVSGLRDDRSDEVGLALDYRRFLQQRGRPALDALVAFMGAYGAFLLRAREQKRRVAQFTTINLHALVRGMMAEYLEILDDGGFRAVAAAVRRSTVSAQALKARGAPNYREIRYDLLADIRRKREVPNALVERIADFVAQYNYENARRREMNQHAPRNVTTEELRGFTALVEQHGASLVGALLAAYGSCREPREDPPEQVPEGDAGDALPATEVDDTAAATEE
jgi:hypothetical protein